MDDNKTRGISEETLRKVVSGLNPDFIKGLPETPEVLYKYVQRRTDPVISKNISYELGLKMQNTRLSDEDYLLTFFKILFDVFNNKTPVSENEKLAAHILVAQTGAGKSNLRKMLLNRNSNIVIVDSDKYKKFRPDVDEILQKDPVNFGALTRN